MEDGSSLAALESRGGTLQHKLISRTFYGVPLLVTLYGVPSLSLVFDCRRGRLLRTAQSHQGCTQSHQGGSGGH